MPAATFGRCCGRCSPGATDISLPKEPAWWWSTAKPASRPIPSWWTATAAAPLCRPISVRLRDRPPTRVLDGAIRWWASSLSCKTGKAFGDGGSHGNHRTGTRGDLGSGEKLAANRSQTSGDCRPRPRRYLGRYGIRTLLVDHWSVYREHRRRL